MGKTNFQSLKELTTSIAEKLDLLASGKLKRAEIEAITEQARELYERLVVIRYKSYESKDVDTDTSKVSVKPIIEEPIESAESDDDELMMFDFSSVEGEEDNSSDIKREKEAKDSSENQQKSISPTRHTVGMTRSSRLTAPITV